MIPQATLQLIHSAIAKKHGKSSADKWLEQQRNRFMPPQAPLASPLRGGGPLGRRGWELSEGLRDSGEGKVRLGEVPKVEGFPPFGKGGRGDSLLTRASDLLKRPLSPSTPKSPPQNFTPLSQKPFKLASSPTYQGGTAQPEGVLSSSWLSTARTQATYQNQTLTTLLERLKCHTVYGLEALHLAEELIGPSWRTALGNAYPLVLMLVKGALEDGRRPGEAGGNDYHVLSNYPSLGVLSAAVMGRKQSYTSKTIQRWLDPLASHAAALRCWLGWRHWMTDTLLEYRTGLNPKTGQAYQTGQSRGPVIGGTLFRVRLSPLRHISQQRLAECTDECPSVIQPLKPELAREWRDLEHDRHEGRTWQKGEQNIALESIDVRIETALDINNRLSKDLLYLDLNKTNQQSKNLLTQQNYLYPDIASEAGAMQLRLDVETTAHWLIECIESGVTEERRQRLLNRYRHAVWTAYKTHRYAASREGFDLLVMATRLAKELRQEERNRVQQGKRFSIKDIPAFVWSVIERRGFAELRRDFGGFQEGRYQRVFSGGIARRLGVVIQ